jgi:anti-anti-sigma factor
MRLAGGHRQSVRKGMSEEMATTRTAWRLPERLVRAEAAEVRVALLDLARSGPIDVALDAGGVLAVDGCGLQLLLAFRNDLAKNGGSLTLVECSRTLARAIALVGLDASFGLRQPAEMR